MLKHMYSNCCALPKEARGGAVGLGTALQVGRSRVRLPMDIDIILLLALYPWKVKAAVAYG
jgi:hypothetical protein